ncbi:MAG: nuclear transport factor 2 family protein [Candidatus Binataceae bacterium]
MAKNENDERRANDIAAITELYNKWRRAWLHVDPKLMLSLFDRDFEGVVYQSEENPEALLSYDAVVSYWNNAVNILSAVPEWKELKKQISFLSNDAAFIWVLLETKLLLNVTPPQELGGKLRCGLGLRKANGYWTIAHYDESRHFLMSPDAQGIWSYNIEHTKRIVS